MPQFIRPNPRLAGELYYYFISVEELVDPSLGGTSMLVASSHKLALDCESQGR
jgi:hypothetical protein